MVLSKLKLLIYEMSTLKNSLQSSELFQDRKELLGNLTVEIELVKLFQLRF